MQVHARPLARFCFLGLLALASALGFSSLGVAADAPSLAQVMAKVDAAEGVRAIKRLHYSYAQYVSDGLWNDLGDLFTDDAVGTFPAGVVYGKKGLREYFMQQAGRKELGLAPGQLNVHLALQPIINLNTDGQSAKGTWHEVTLLGHYKKDANWEGGIFENEYKLDHGVWKISKIAFYRQYEGAYDEYGHKAPGSWNIPYHFDGAHLGVTVPAAALKALAANASDATPEQLAACIQALADETAVQNLQHSFGYYLDRKLWDDVADLFTANGTLEFDQRGVYRGAAHIKQALADFHGAGKLQFGDLFDHIYLGTVVTVAPDGKTASARTSQLNELGKNAEYARWEQGTYENSYIKENGVWKLAAVHYYPRFISDYDQGWAVDARPAPGMSTTLPPDAKPTQKYASYPEAYVVGLHFMNPVTGNAVQYGKGTVVKVATVKDSTPQAMSGGVDLTALDKRVDVEIGVDAVENLMSSYGYYIDESDWSSMSDTYAEKEGAKELTGAGVYVGREKIRKALVARGPAGGRSANFFTIHQLVQPVIHVSEDGKSAKARLRLFQSGGNADGSSGSWIGGIYENTAVFENGEWKFGIQDLHHLFNASYRNGWARFKAQGAPAAASAPAPVAAQPPATAGAAPAAGAAGRAVQGGGITQGLGGARSPNSWMTEIPPDRKIRARQYAFPEITEPAFHYKNPVTGRMPADLLP